MGRQSLEDAPDHPMILSAVLQPIFRNGLEAHEVSTLVNSPGIDSPECIKSVSHESRPPIGADIINRERFRNFIDGR
jgi:hypothetical protein